MKKAVAALGLLLMAGCANGIQNSYVEAITSADAKVIGSGITAFVSDRQKPGAGPIALEVPKGDGLLAPEIRSAMEGAGYKIVDVGGKHRLRYQVTPLDTGMLVRLSLDGGDAARFYERSAGTLAPTGPFTSRDDS